MSTPVTDSTGKEEQIITLPAVGSLLQCSLDNVYGCAENFLLEILALASIVYGVIALRKILKDRNQILEVWDKIIVFIGFGQFVMLAVFYGVFNTQIWQFSIRSLFFANSILICHTVFCIHEIKEETKQNLIKILKGTFIYLFGLWFFCGFLHKNIPEAPYNCMRIDWMLISGSNLILGCIQAYVTLSIIQSIQNYTNPDVGYPEEGIQNYSKDDGENRKTQLTGLMLGIFVPAFIQFLWDYVAHTHAANLIECNDYFYASSFLTLLLFLIGKFICFFLTPMSIFFVFYWKNRNYINTVQDNPNGQFFFDRRSELIEKYSF